MAPAPSFLRRWPGKRYILLTDDISDVEKKPYTDAPSSPSHQTCRDTPTTPTSIEDLERLRFFSLHEPTHRRSSILPRALFATISLLILGFIFCPTAFLSTPHSLITSSTTRPLRPFPSTPDPDITPLSTLPAELLPTEENNRSLLVIGDVHASLEPLQALLNKTNFNKETDHLILTGDTIAKGPDAAGVLKLIRSLGATPVRGNHEDRLIRHAREIGRFDPPSSTSWDAKARQKQLHDTLLEGENPGAAELAETLPLEDLEFIRSFPVMLELGHLPLPKSHHAVTGTVKSVVVHGGLMPGLALHEQDLGDVMEMRTLARHEVEGWPRGHKKGKKAKQWRWVPSKEPDAGAPWHDVWTEEQDLAFAEWWREHPRSSSVPVAHQRELDSARQTFTQSRIIRNDGTASDSKKGKDGEDGREKKERAQWRKGGRGGEIDEHLEAMRCIYGHDSKLGLVAKKWSTGLDGACVRGGQLHALVMGAGGREEIVSVRC